MPLRGYQPETREISLHDDNSFVVQGLSFNEITVLIREHFPDLDSLFTLFQNFKEIDASQFQEVAMAVLSNAPGLAANMIALAAGEGDATDAAKLPFPTQLRALTDIAELTFAEVGGIKKGLEIVATLLKNGKTQKLAEIIKNR